MKILITGATGFIGRHLLEDIAADDLGIRVMTRKKDVSFGQLNGRIEVIHADLSDKNSLDAAFEGVDLLINTAAELKDPARFISTNITGTENIIEMVRKHKVKKMIHLSSVGVAGMQFSASKVVVGEQEQCHPKNEYERTKLTSEMKLMEAAGNGGVSLIVLRPTNVYGEEHPRNALLNFFRTIQNRKKIFSSRDAMVNYVYVKDLTGVMRHFIFNPAKKKIYNIGSPARFTDFIHDCADALGVKENYSTIPSFLLRSPAIAGYFGSAALRGKLRTLCNRVEYNDAAILGELGQYRFGNAQGIRRTITAYKNKGLL